MVSRRQFVVRKKAKDLKKLLVRITPDTVHAEVDAGPPQGKEEW